MKEKENTRELVVVDVKHYKKVKKALHKSEERYRQLFENVPIGVYRTTYKGLIIDANRALVEMLGYSSFADLAKNNIKESFLPAEYPRSAIVARLEREGEIRGLESRWLKKDGTLIHVRENARLVRDDDGQVLFEGTVEDISRQKLAEEAQKSRTQQLEILNCIISSGNISESLTGMLDCILDNVLKPLAFDMAAIFRYDPAAKKVDVLAYRGVSKKFFRDEKYMSIDTMPFSQVLRRGQPVFVDNAAAILPDLAGKWQWRMAASIPMLSKGIVVGAINVASCSRSVFSAEEKNILQLIAKESGTLLSKLQTESMLRESEKYYRSLIDTSPDVIAVTDMGGNLQMVNRRFVSLSGYYLDEIIGRNSFQFVAEADQAVFAKKIKNYVKTKKLSLEYGFKKKDGEVVPLELSASLLLDERGKPKGLIGFGRDISERKRAQLRMDAVLEALRQSENKYRELVENHNDVIFSVDVTGKIEYISPAVTRITGYRPEEITGRNLFDFFSLQDRNRYREQMQRTVDSNSSIGEYLITVKDKSQKWIRASSRCVMENGKIVGIHGIMSDITQRMQAERELLESKALIDAVVDNAPLMIFLKEAIDLRFVLFNRAGEELLGHDRKNMLGKNNLDLFPAEQAAFFMAKDREVLDGGAGMLDIPEEPIMTAKKVQRWLHTRKVCIRGADGTTKYLLGISEDITERKEAEARLLAYQEQLRALTSEMTLIEERERRRLAAALHDRIGQNLALCMLKVTALKTGTAAAALDGEIRQVQALLEQSIQDTRSLIFDLSPPVLYELGFASALEWLVERMQEQFHVPMEFVSQHPRYPLGIDQKVILFQIVREMLINVGKHSRASSARVTLALEKKFIKIQVSDNGVGFDVAQASSQKNGNSGFGIFSMRERLNYLGGSMEIRSIPGQGTQIMLQVPQQGREGKVAPAGS